MPLADFVHEGYRLKLWTNQRHGRINTVAELIQKNRQAVYMLFGDEVIKDDYKKAFRKAGLKIEGVTEALEIEESEGEVAYLKKLIQSKDQTIMALQAALKSGTR